METDSEQRLLQRLEAGYSLPPLSAVAVKLVDMAADETTSAADLAAVIEKDPSLTVRLLKLANSAFFGGDRGVTSLKQAVVKVGFQRLRVMALSLSLRETFPMGRRGGMDYERFWRTSLYRALLARSLARHTSLCHPEEAFVAGLILEIGLLVFHDIHMGGHPDAICPVDPEELETSIPWERRTFGVDHRAIGEAALRYWRFPESLRRCQTVFGKDALSEHQPGLVRVTELSRRLALDLVQEARDVRGLFEGGERVFGLEPEAVGEILANTFSHVEDIAQGLRLELDRDRDLLDVMERANRALGDMSREMERLRKDPSERDLPTLDGLPEDRVSARTLAAVTHEIRNPLMAVGGFARRLAEALGPASEGGRYARVILEEAARLEEVLSRMSAGQGPSTSS